LDILLDATMTGLGHQKHAFNEYSRPSACWI